MANPTVFNAIATNPGGTGSTITVTLSTHAVDDLLIIYVANTGNTLWTGNPTGWSRIDQRTVGTSSNGLVGTWLWRKVVSGDTLPLANPICTLGATVTRVAVCRTVRGADLESPFITPNYGSRGFGVGTTNPVQPPTVVTPAPEILTLHCYGQRAATNAPEPTDYTQDAEAIVSGTLVLNASSKIVADQNTTLSSQSASPTSGARWVAGIICIPSADYPYYRSGSQATTASGTSVTPTKPTGTTNSDVNGNKDVMVITVEGSGSTTLAMTDTALWTEIGGAWSGTTGGGGSSVKKFWCHATASPNMQATRTGTGEISACVITYYNCHQTAPIGNFDADARATSSTPSWDAVTRSTARCLMQATCVADGTPTYTSPSGWLERMDGLGIVCADQTFNATGSTASNNFGLSASNPTFIGLLEIQGLLAGGGADLTLTLSDDAATLADTLSKIGGQLQSFSDAVTLTDALVTTIEHQLTFTDDANTLADGEVQQLGVAQSVADTLATLADDYAQLLVYLLALTDSTAANWADEHQLLLAHFLALADTLPALTDTTAIHVEQREEFADSFTLSDVAAIILTYRLPASDSINTLADAYTQQADGLLEFSDTLALSDSPALGYGLVIADDAANLADVYSQQLQGVVSAIELTLDDALTLADAAAMLSFGYLLTLDDSIDSLTDTASLLLVHLLALSDTFTITDTYTAILHHSLFLDDDINTFVDLLVTDSPQAPEIQVGVVDTLEPLSDSLDITLSYHLPLTDNAALLADSTAKTVGLQVIIGDNIQLLTDSIMLSGVWLLELSDAITLTDSLATFGTNALVVADSFILSDTAVVELRGPSFNLVLDDALTTFDDSIILSLGIELQYTLILSDSVTLTDHYFDLRHPYTPSAKRHIVVPSRARVTVVPLAGRTTVVE